MKILILPGAGKSNKEWASNLAKAIKKRIPTADIKLHEYDFWMNGQPDSRDDRAQLKFEQSIISDEYKDKHFDLVLTKSMGSYFALSLADDIGWSNLFLIGPPLNEAHLFNVISEVKKLNSVGIIKKVIINRSDPLANSEWIDDLESIVTGKILIMLDDNSGHTYKNYDEYAQLIKDIV